MEVLWPAQWLMAVFGVDEVYDVGADGGPHDVGDGESSGGCRWPCRCARQCSSHCEKEWGPQARLVAAARGRGEREEGREEGKVNPRACHHHTWSH